VTILTSSSYTRRPVVDALFPVAAMVIITALSGKSKQGFETSDILEKCRKYRKHLLPPWIFQSFRSKKFRTGFRSRDSAFLPKTQGRICVFAK